MGCNCGKNRVGTTQYVRGQGGRQVVVLGYQVCYPDGTCTPESQPIFSMVECRKMIRDAGGGTIHRLLKDVA